jgi:hypothetical protein
VPVTQALPLRTPGVTVISSPSSAAMARNEAALNPQR